MSKRVLVIVGGLVLVGHAGCSLEAPPEETQTLTPQQRGIVYQRLKYYQGIDETVVLHKAPGNTYARFNDGRTMSLKELNKADREARIKRFGPFVPGFQRALLTSRADDVHEVAIHFRPDFDWDAAYPKLYGKDRDAARLAQDDLKKAIAKKAVVLQQELLEAGITTTSTGKAMPVIFGHGTAASILGLKARPDLDLVSGLTRRRPMQRADPDEVCVENSYADTVQLHHIDTVFNDQGFFGAEQNVGILEDIGDCTLYTDHEAFDYSPSPEYSNATPQSCINAHGTGVASVISGSVNGEKRGAAEARFYYPNSGNQTEFPSPAGTVTTTVCEADATLAAYEWLQNSEVHTVNESYGCLHKSISCGLEWANDREGLTQDYFARVYGTTIVKAAGNNNCEDLEPSQPACPWSLNSICVGTAGPDLEMSCTSSSLNLEFPSGTRHDREEPDVTAIGGRALDILGSCPQTGYNNPNEICVADTNANDSWTGNKGTSIAAPAITAMVTLFKEACSDNFGGFIDQLSIRSIVRTAAYGANPDGDPYSTPRPFGLIPPYDGEDGAGLLYADELMVHCDPDEGVQTGIVDLTDPDPGDMPGGPSPYQSEPPYQPPGAQQPQSAPNAFNYSPGGETRPWKLLKSFEHLYEGETIRATFSWNACGGNAGSAPGSPATDFDLFPAACYAWG